MLRHWDELFSTTPWAMTAILGAKDIYISARTRGYAWFFYGSFQVLSDERELFPVARRVPRRVYAVVPGV